MGERRSQQKEEGKKIREVRRWEVMRQKGRRKAKEGGKRFLKVER